MKKLISTLRVFVTDEGDEKSTRFRPVSDEEQELIIDLKGDAFIEKDLSIGISFPKDYETIIAHEIGHFVAFITHNLTMDNLFVMFNGHLPAELEAWRLAEKMDRVKFNKKLAKKVIELDKKAY